jgi:hypothetical protein
MMMKLHTRRLMAIAGLLLAGAAAALNAQTTDTVTDVPFAFTVGTATLPRDTYRISRLPGHTDAFLIRGLRHGAIMVSQPDGASETDPGPRLVFHRYADSYFLREVRMPGNTGFKLPRTRGELQAAEQLASRSTPEVVVLHARPE